MDKELESAVMDCLAETRPKIGGDFWTEFIQTPADGLANFHFGLGLYLRNNVLVPESELYGLFTREGITHKDEMSTLMMQRWHEALNENP